MLHSTDRIETLRYMRFFRGVWAHGRTEAESRLNTVENIAAMAAGAWRETDEGLLEAIAPPNTEPDTHPPIGPSIVLPTLLAALHTGDEVHEYLRNKHWTTNVLKRTLTTWPVNSAFSTGKYCPKDASVVRNEKDIVGHTLQRSMSRTRIEFENAWLKHEKAGVDEWRQWVGRFTDKPILDDDGGEVAQSPTIQRTKNNDEHQEATEMQDPRVAEGDKTEETQRSDTSAKAGHRATELTVSGDSNARMACDTQISLKWPSINRKRQRVSDEGVDNRRSRVRPMKPEISDAPFQFAQQVTCSVAADHVPIASNLEVGAEKASTSGRGKGKGKGKGPIN
jgi:hypothetical protein